MRSSSIALLGVGWATILGCTLEAGRDPDPDRARAAEIVTAAPIANFARVSPGIYRGARPSDEGLAYLKSIGVRTVLDLEIGDWVEARPADIEHEKQAVEELGLAFVARPMSAFQPFVDDDAMNETLAVLADPAAGPIYVHCKHGQDRTGLVIGLERVLGEGWDAIDAHDEMLAAGFHRYFWGLEHYYEEKTGFED